VTVLALRVYVFVCDTCERDTGEIAPPAATNGARAAWRVAKASGWARRGARHYCPDHASP